jgi:hypothetical protein
VTLLPARGGLEHARRQARVQACADPHQHAAAHGFQRRHEQVRGQHEPGQQPQRGLVAAGQHAVVDLHHVQRRQQQQHVDEAAEHGDRPQRAAQLAQRGTQVLGGGGRRVGHRGRAGA